LKKAKDAAGKESKKMHKIGCEMNETRRRSVFCCLPEGKERQGGESVGKVREMAMTAAKLRSTLCFVCKGRAKSNGNLHKIL